MLGDSVKLFGLSGREEASQGFRHSGGREGVLGDCQGSFDGPVGLVCPRPGVRVAAPLSSRRSASKVLLDFLNHVDKDVPEVEGGAVPYP